MRQIEPIVVFAMVLGLSASPAFAQTRVTAVDETQCFKPSEEGTFTSDSLLHVRLTLIGGDSLVLNWQPATPVGGLAIESESGADIWWIEGTFEPPIAIRSDPPGALEPQQVDLSELVPGARINVMVMDAMEEKATWWCYRMFALDSLP